MRIDHSDTFIVQGPPQLDHDPQIVIDALSELVTPKRLERIEQIVAKRVGSVSLVLDGVHDPHNISAMLRSADAFGVQNVFAVREREDFVASKGVSKGAHRWLDIHTFSKPEDCLHEVRKRGFQIFAAMMDATLHLDDLRNKKKVALVFGNEHRGVSPTMRENIDGVFAIPMRGFVESLNVSVAAAISLQTLTASSSSTLPLEHQKTLKARYLMNSVRDAARIVQDYVAAR